MAPKYRGCKFCITITSSQHFRVPHICIRDDNNQTKKNERILQLNNIKINQLGNKFLVPFPHSCIMLARIFFFFYFSQCLIILFPFPIQSLKNTPKKRKGRKTRTCQHEQLVPAFIYILCVCIEPAEKTWEGNFLFRFGWRSDVCVRIVIGNGWEVFRMSKIYGINMLFI